MLIFLERRCLFKNKDIDFFQRIKGKYWPRWAPGLMATGKSLEMALVVEVQSRGPA